jgi:hypothetical protein
LAQKRDKNPDQVVGGPLAPVKKTDVTYILLVILGGRLLHEHVEVVLREKKLR